MGLLGNAFNKIKDSASMKAREVAEKELAKIGLQFKQEQPPTPALLPIQEPEQPAIRLQRYGYEDHLKLVARALARRNIEHAAEIALTLQESARGHWDARKTAAALSFYMDQNSAAELANEEVTYYLELGGLISEIEASEDTGIVFVKEWALHSDEKTCAACKAMAGTIAPLGGVYPVNGPISLPHGIRPAIILDLHATFLHAGCRCFHQTRVFDPATGEIS